MTEYLYLYLNQIESYTSGKCTAFHILHAASTGKIDLYVHTPELKHLTDQLSKIQAEDTGFIEREYNFCQSLKDRNFAESSFKLAGSITGDMTDGTVPFILFLDHWDEPHTQDRMSWRETNDQSSVYYVKTRVNGADFIVFKSDLDALLNSTKPQTADSSTYVQNLERTIVALAHALKNDKPKFKYGESPNLTQISEFAVAHLSDGNDNFPTGWTPSSIKKTLEAATKNVPLPE